LTVVSKKNYGAIRTNAERREPVRRLARELAEEGLGLVQTGVEVVRDAGSATTRNRDKPLASLLGVGLEVLSLLGNELRDVVSLGTGLFSSLVRGLTGLVVDVLSLVANVPVIVRWYTEIRTS
jgi:hypothetical protein